MARKKTTADEAAEFNFEKSVAELEAIVAAMEEEQLPLEDLVAKYEQGVKLLDRCQTVLLSAKKRLQTIAADQTRKRPDEDSLDPEPGMAHDPSAIPDESDDDDDIRLF